MQEVVEADPSGSSSARDVDGGAASSSGPRLRHLETSGFQWQRSGGRHFVEGVELRHKKLAAALKKKLEDSPEDGAMIEFTASELKAMKVGNVRTEHFVEVDGVCFQPAGRCRVRCVATASSLMREALQAMWAKRSPLDVYETLKNSDIVVTNKSDKAVQLEKVIELGYDDHKQRLQDLQHDEFVNEIKRDKEAEDVKGTWLAALMAESRLIKFTEVVLYLRRGKREVNSATRQAGRQVKRLSKYSNTNRKIADEENASLEPRRCCQSPLAC